jgi:Tol biopolymer transport system component/serine/threonine protein kinase
MVSEGSQLNQVRPGSRIAHYEILGEIAHGGMGIVYRARDWKLDRNVALKCPWPDALTNPAHRERFLREIRATANLSHPHIVPLFDAFEHDGIPWLAMQLVEGQSLRDILDERGALPINKALRYSEALADALQAAHRQDILHRDLTPRNVIVSKNDWVFLTDFGLARSFANPNSRHSTETTRSRSHLTSDGQAVGTPRYMSPEQVLGRNLDARSDIFSVGLLLYETCAGTPAFTGRTQGELIDNILHYDPPPLSRVRPETPEGLDDILFKAIAKKRDDRYQTAGELARAIRGLLRSLESKELRAFKLPSWKPSLAIAVGLPAILVAGALFLMKTWLPPSGAWLPPVPTRQLTRAIGWEGHPAISPNGNFVAYVYERAGNMDIWLVDIDGRSPRSITEAPSSDFDPAWFPDGKTLAFVSDRASAPAIWKTSMLGGSATLLVPDATSPSLSPDGEQIAFARAGSSGSTRIAIAPLSDTSRATFLTSDADGLWDHAGPAWSPDGTRIAYTAHNDLWIVPVDGGPARQLTADDDFDLEPAWSSDGRDIYFTSHREGTVALWRVSSDGGPLVRLTPGTGSESSPSVSGDGSRIAYSTLVEASVLVLLDLVSGEQHIWKEGSDLVFPALAPDGKSLVFVSDREAGKLDLWLHRLEENAPSGSPRRLTDQAGVPSHPSFSPDGKWIAYYRIVANTRNLWIVPSTGGQPVQVTKDPAPDIHPAWSPDGSLLAFASERENRHTPARGQSQIWVVPVAEGRATSPARQVTSGDVTAIAPTFSPDGTEIAYIGLTGSESEVFIAALNGQSADRRITSGAGAGRVRWSPASNTLFVTGDWGSARTMLKQVHPESGAVTSLAPELNLGFRASYNFDVSLHTRLLCFTRTERQGHIWVLENKETHP